MVIVEAFNVQAAALQATRWEGEVFVEPMIVPTSRPGCQLLSWSLPDSTHILLLRLEAAATAGGDRLSSHNRRSEKFLQIEYLSDSTFNLVGDSRCLGGMLACHDARSKTFGYQFQIGVHSQTKLL